MTQNEKQFLCMPFMHSESLFTQRESIKLFGSLEGDNTDEYAHKHHDVIAQFGRFPGINAALGRVDTPEEAIYNEGGSPF